MNQNISLVKIKDVQREIKDNENYNNRAVVSNYSVRCNDKLASIYEHAFV